VERWYEAGCDRLANVKRKKWKNNTTEKIVYYTISDESA
jgi:hypothetical protein